MSSVNALSKANSPMQRDCVFLAEADHRLLNNLQTVASLLSLQSRQCVSREAAVQLASAAARVSSLQRIHRRLHSFQPGSTVAFKAFLENLQEDFALVLSPNRGEVPLISVRGVEVHLPARTAAALAFIANELLTNASKYGSGAITADLTASPDGCVLSVSNDGPPLRDEFDIAHCTGLGMTIVQALARQIGGTLNFHRAGPMGGPTFQIRFPRVQNTAVEGGAPC